MLLVATNCKRLTDIDRADVPTRSRDCIADDRLGTMSQLAFGPDDEDEFHAARDRLLEEFESWLDESRDEADGELVADAGVFVDWRWGYSSGELDRYDDADIAEFLLEWCPRKVSAPQEFATGMCAAVEAFIEFMSATGRLEGGASRAARLMALVDELAPTAYDAMGDESKFGMAKSVFGGFALQDLPESPEELQALLDQRMEEFNALPFEERRRQTDGHIAPRAPRVVELPFVHVPPSAAEIERSARVSPAVAKFEALREYLGESGRALTEKGNLRLADARELVKLLDSGDEFDPAYEGTVDKTRSSEQLPRLTFLVEWALACKVVRRVKGRLVPVKSWAEMPPVARAERAYAALLELGPLRGLHRRSSWLDNVHEMLDDGIPHWLSTLLPAEAEREFDELVDWALEHAKAQATVRLQEWMVILLDSTVPGDIAQIFEMLVWAGVVEWEGRDRLDDTFGRTRWGHGALRLTPLGRHVLPGQLPAIGYRLRSIPDLATASATDLLDALTMADLDLDDAVTRWQPDTPPSVRAQTLADATMAAGTAEERLIGFAALSAIGPDAAAPFVRPLLDSPVAGHAALFLLENGLAADAEVGMFLDVGPMVDILSTVLDAPEALCGLFLTSMPAADAPGMIAAMWRHPQPETLAVLETLGKHLPDKHLAKAARKAVYQHRSWMANSSQPVR